MEDEDILDTNGQNGAAEDDEEEGDEDEEVYGLLRPRYRSRRGSRADLRLVLPSKRYYPT